MSQDFVLQAQTRQDVGKGASRRLRREAELMPAILYGGDSEPLNLTFEQRTIRKALENEAFYSSIINLELDGKKQKVVVKAIQRHPYKQIVQHMDFMRVAGNTAITMNVPLHFINQDNAPGVKAGGNALHNISDIEIKCKAKDLPEFIDVDMGNIELDQTVHLSDLKLPKGVELTTDISDSAHNSAVASIHMPKAAPVEEPEEAAPEADAEESASDENDKSE